MANAGIKSTQSGTSMRSIMTALSGEVNFCSSSFGEMEIATSNADGSMRDLSDILAHLTRCPNLKKQVQHRHLWARTPCQAFWLL